MDLNGFIFSVLASLLANHLPIICKALAQTKFEERIHYYLTRANYAFKVFVMVTWPNYVDYVLVKTFKTLLSPIHIFKFTKLKFKSFYLLRTLHSLSKLRIQTHRLGYASAIFVVLCCFSLATSMYFYR